MVQSSNASEMSSERPVRARPPCTCAGVDLTSKLVRGLPHLCLESEVGSSVGGSCCDCVPSYHAIDGRRSRAFPFRRGLC